MFKLILALVLSSLLPSAFAQAPDGEVKGNAYTHTAASSKEVIQNSQVSVPAVYNNGQEYFGKFRDAPSDVKGNIPIVIFMHGSSGLGLKAIEEWQHWLSKLGVASIAPDSFVLPDRITYKSPVSKEVYEKIHALRASEIQLAIQALKNIQWVDKSRIVLAGTSEGGTAVARYDGSELAGRIIFSWSCENNYFVTSPITAVPLGQPVLNVISANDPFFSPSNKWLGNNEALGHCANALKDHKNSSIVLIPGAPHTLINLRAARQPVEKFLLDIFKM